MCYCPKPVVPAPNTAGTGECPSPHEIKETAVEPYKQIIIGDDKHEPYYHMQTAAFCPVCMHDFCMCFTVPPTKVPPTMKEEMLQSIIDIVKSDPDQYEYKDFYTYDVNALNEQGRKGWMLVARSAIVASPACILMRKK